MRSISLYHKNELLFSNAFLNNMQPDSDQLGAVYTFMHGTREWFLQADLSSENSFVTSFIRPILQNQSLDLTQIQSVSSAYTLAAPWDANQAQGILFVVPANQPLDGALQDGRIPKGQHWMVKAVDCARSLNIRWVVLTNARLWRILDAQGLRRYEAYLEIDLESLVQSTTPGKEYDLAAYLFHSLFSLEKGFLHDAETGLCGLDQFAARSFHYTERTEQYLKYSVCDNLDVPGGGDGIIAQLCLGLVRASDPSGNYSITEEERNAIYRDATYLLYRLLFIFYAEARGLLPVGEPAYDEISLRQLVDEAVNLQSNPDQAAEHPTSLWEALLSLFNRIDVGDLVLHVPAFNGGLFDNAQRAYLNKYAIQNPYLADALVQLAFIRDPRQPDRMDRIDYRDLSVRHLGNLYEGMIEYRLFIAEEDLLARREKDGGIRYLPQKDNFRKPNDELIPFGQVYFAQSPHERKSTGTHYTLEDLVERLVRQTVLRLLDERWQAFENEFNALLKELEAISPDRRPALQEFIDQRLLKFIEEQVLSLRVCDPAMGSGHFLVHTSHQITNFIIHALARTNWNNPSIDLNPSTWRRRVVEQCLYGVDINPMAAELAKLSLWLVSMQTDRPLSFLDHHLKHGNSLLGSQLKEIEAILNENEFHRVTSRTAVAEARGQYAFRELLPVLDTLSKANNLMGKIAAKVVSRVVDIHQQALDYADVEAILAPYRRIGDLLVAQKMGWKIKGHDLRRLAKALETTKPIELDAQKKELWEQACQQIAERNTFHWELEFLPIFSVDMEYESKNSHNGFDIILGNPPFLGGKKISTELGNTFLEFLQIAYSPAKGSADLSSYFFRIAFELSRNMGLIGLVATNSISQGETRETGLSFIIKKSGVIYDAQRFINWGGDASVEVNLVCIQKPLSGLAKGVKLDNKDVPFISSWLDDLPEFRPTRLTQNQDQSFNGDFLHGTGFILDPVQANNIITSDPNNAEVIFPYISGIDINSSVDQGSNRFVICFHDWNIEKTKQYTIPFGIVVQKVKPEREKVNRDSHRKNWWLYGDYRKGLRKANLNHERVLVRSAVSENHLLAFLPSRFIFSHAVIIFAFDDYYHFSLLQSNTHEIWLRRQASTMRTDVRYTPSDCFQTFPFPQIPSEVVILQANKAGLAFYECRQQIMQFRQTGLTKLYNTFNNPEIQDHDIVEMRRLHIAMDESVLTCYGWQDIGLRHDFYPNDRKKIRFAPAPEAQRDIFIRLMELNQKIAADEAIQGLTPALNSEEEEQAE
jgi:methylase of polypeptide subunit release factors